MTGRDQNNCSWSK